MARSGATKLTIAYGSDEAEVEIVKVGYLSLHCLSGQRVCKDLTFLVLFVSRQKEHRRKLEANSIKLS